VSRAKVRTIAPDGTGLRYLGTLGTVSGLSYSFTVPGGCEQLACTLQPLGSLLRTDALNPGRTVEVMLGGGSVWDGILDEPQQGDGDSWSITAQGSGTLGSLYAADYSGSWSAAVPDQVITDAISRGLNWIAPSIGHPAGLFLGQAPDPGSVMVDDMLNQLTQLGGLTWQVKHAPRGNLPQAWPVSPLTPNRLLIAGDPAPRTLGGDYNAINLRYQVTADNGAGHPATFATVWRTDAASIAKHGRRETYYDLSSVGPMLLAGVQDIGDAVLARYQRASFAGPFTVRTGQLLTLGGQPVDLGVFYCGNEGPMTCRTLLTDEAFGGEVNAGPVTFMVGRYTCDDDAGTASVEPFGSVREDFASLLASVAAGARPRVFRHKKKHKPKRGHLVSVHSHQPPGRGRHMHPG
jgi:hypothetical protein